MLVPRFYVRQKITVMVNRYQLFGDNLDGSEGPPVLTSERQKAIRDRYTVTVPDPRLDFRVAASMAVELDALQSR